MKYKLLALRRFNDGNAYPNEVKKGETVVVDEVTKSQMLQSDPDGFQIVGKVVPKSTVAKKGRAKKATG